MKYPLKKNAYKPNKIAGVPFKKVMHIALLRPYTLSEHRKKLQECVISC